MKDLIDRQAAIDAAKDWYEGLICGSIKGRIKRLNALPTIQPVATDTNVGSMISRQAAIDQLHQSYNLLDAEQRLEGLPSAQPEQRWIPCSEKKPEKSGKYYVSGGGKVWICEFVILNSFAGVIGGWCNDVANPVVQAWMPPPEPYGEEGGE